MVTALRRRLAASLVALALLAGLSFASSAAAQAATVPGNLEDQVAAALAEVNKIRKAAGKGPLTLSCSINDVAQAWSVKQANAKKMKHNPDYSDQIPSGWSRAGETVAAGYSSFASAVKDGWKHSSGHKKIMTGDYTHVGFGMAKASGTNGDYYYTADFAKYSGSTGGLCEPVDDGSLPDRIAGPDRYTTASYIASVWDWDRDADIVFLATGENYPDALAAAAAAAKLGAPVVLTPKKSLPAEVKARLKKLKPERIVILGSTAAISTSVENAVKGIVGSGNVVRLGGSDRYETMRKIVRYAWDDPQGSGLLQAPTVVIATGRNFPDALSAGPGAATDDGAVVLVDGKLKSIPPATLGLIAALGPERIVIAGGTPAVSSGIQNQLAGLYPGAVKRLSGSDRYDTSRLVVDHFFDSAETVFFATGRNFPDALAGAALAASLSAPLIVVDKSCVSSKTKALVQGLGASERVLLGSSTVISGSVASLKTC